MFRYGALTSARPPPPARIACIGDFAQPYAIGARRPCLQKAEMYNFAKTISPLKMGSIWTSPAPRVGPDYIHRPTSSVIYNLQRSAYWALFYIWERGMWVAGWGGSRRYLF